MPAVIHPHTPWICEQTMFGTKRGLSLLKAALPSALNETIKSRRLSTLLLYFMALCRLLHLVWIFVWNGVMHEKFWERDLLYVWRRPTLLRLLLEQSYRWGMAISDGSVHQTMKTNSVPVLERVWPADTLWYKTNVMPGKRYSTSWTKKIKGYLRK